MTDPAQAQIDSTLEQIFDHVRSLAKLRVSTPFIPGKTTIPCAGRVYGEEELVALTQASLEFWLTAGRFHEEFEKGLRGFLGLPKVLMVNSGSSANLAAVATLMSPKLGNDRLRAGDEVITVAAAFPTTVAPLLQLGLVPVFLDILPHTYNIDTQLLDPALSSRTRAIFLAHTMGNPFDLRAITEFCKKHDLWLVEDNCDALGSLYDGKKTGSFGDLSTMSFYPAHHITTGEGGAVACSSSKLAKVVESIRDWGRDCYCKTGCDGTCGKRFDWQLGELPLGYDHKYIYSNLGFNLKATDMQAAIGVQQLARLDEFGKKRRQNWSYLRNALDDLSEDLVLPEPTANSDPSWFGFLISTKPGSRISRTSIVRELENNRIQTRMLFAGNLLKQPALVDLRRTRLEDGMAEPYRVVGNLTNTDLLMHHGFWIGVYPGLSEEMLHFVSDVIHGAVRRGTT